MAEFPASMFPASIWSCGVPIIQCHLDEDVARRLSVFACLNDRDVGELAASWIAEAARRAIPCTSGKPTDAQQRLIWEAQDTYISPC